jgi:cyclopropane fatty-acyl-phospholipid synthase-like methyltransferase
MIRRLFFEIRYLLGKVPWDTGITPPELLNFMAARPPGNALDIGCGTGTNAITLAKRGWEATGIDFSAQAIARARRKARHAGLDIRFLQGDVRALGELPGPYDLCLDIGCFHSLPLGARKTYADRIHGLLGAGGTYLLYTFLKPPDDTVSSWPSEQELRTHFGTKFDIHTVEYGTDQRRTSAWFTMQRKA